jgi:hypothetical protein
MEETTTMTATDEISTSTTVRIERFARYVRALDETGREDMREPSREVVAASPDRAPRWCFLQAELMLTALTAVDVGGDPLVALDSAVAALDDDPDDIESALGNIDAYVTVKQRQRRKGTARAAAAYGRAVTDLEGER